MPKIQPRRYSGTRDLTPEMMIQREDIITMLRDVFNRFGFAPLETPALEYLEILLGKYGDEEKLIYKLDYRNDQPAKRLALRYDLTVPLARCLAQTTDLILPFKRYQIQPVWRADRPQPRQGRFREFYQCDIDTIGVDDISADAEIVQLQYYLLQALKIPGFLIRVSDRRLLRGLVELAGISLTLEASVCTAIDKQDKIGREGVQKELKERGIDTDSGNRLLALLEQPLTWTAVAAWRERLSASPQAVAALDDLSRMHSILVDAGVNMEQVVPDPWLARGLDYYTGPIFETVIPQLPHMGSVTGGGRWDGLIGLYSDQDLPATGCTIGLDRLLAAMEQLDLLQDRSTRTCVLVTLFFEETTEYCRKLATKLREAGVPTETFLGQGKLKKQFNYANRKKIPWVVVAGIDEMEQDLYTLKEMTTGQQGTVSLEELLERISKQ
jgi:histidyl-tRNA synthetase